MDSRNTAWTVKFVLNLLLVALFFVYKMVNNTVEFQPSGTFNDYVDKKRWVGGQKMIISVHLQI